MDQNVFRLPGGPIGALQTEEDHLGKGFAKIIVKEISKRFASLKQDVSACVLNGNVASHKVFTKLGFKNVDVVRWVLITYDN